jgi:hypothetical protein
VNTQELLQVLAIVVPVVLAVVGDGVRTRTKVAVIEQRQRDQGADLVEMQRRQARHERDPVHGRLRGR